MQKLNLKTISNLHTNYIEVNLILYINTHYLCDVTLHNNVVKGIGFHLALPKICGENVMEYVYFSDNLSLEVLSSFHIYQLYKESVARYWKTSPYKEVMRNYHLNKANKYA
jgi:hypothetical protein